MIAEVDVNGNNMASPSFVTGIVGAIGPFRFLLDQ
jgi:hypothetical protein